MNSVIKSFGLVALCALVSAGVSILCLRTMPTPNESSNASLVRYSQPCSESPASVGSSVDFTSAAEQSVGAVVHVKTKYYRQQQYSDPFYQFFFGRPHQQSSQESRGSGSGVILSDDGYIVTNNHVIDQASEIEVVLNDKRSFPARLVGTDPNTDIALLKVEATDLPTLKMGNSDDLKVGEWVLAVGNPFNLTSTVTAGIVSAKARNINILSTEMKIESFIQTDAAVNPGNSGGALVNTRGELVGINTAIASQTGSYAGYAFAVPTSIVEKVVADLRQYGSVQRALLGIRMLDITQEVQQQLQLPNLEGVYVAEVVTGSAAHQAGLLSGDVILALDGQSISSSARLQELMAGKNPGDTVDLLIRRQNRNLHLTVTLSSY